MATNPYWLNAVRHPEDTGVGHIRRTISFDSNGAADGIPIGGLEAGAIPLHAHVIIEEAFDAGTTNVLTLGTTADPDGFAESADVAADAAGFKGNLDGALTGIPLAGDTVVYATYTQTGTAATAGKATLVLTFVNKREIEGIPFPNN